MSATDPLRTMWSALDTGGFGPHGKDHDFRSRCPGHDGDSPDALHVSAGADGRALVHCFAHGCDEQMITSGLGLGVADLFPAGHRHARRRRSRPARRSDFHGNALDVADMLAALDRLGEDWRVEIVLRCPYCGDPWALFVACRRYASFMSCPSLCTAEMASQALAGQLHDAGVA